MKSYTSMILVTVTLMAAVTLVFSAPTSENSTALILSSSNHSETTNTTSLSSSTGNSTSHASIIQRIGRFLGISLGLGLYGDNPYPFGQPYPCTVYGYPAPYAPPLSNPCGYPYYFG